MSSATAPVYVIGTLDTKAEDVCFIVEALRAEGVSALLVDVGTLNAPQAKPDIDRSQVAAYHPGGAGAALGSKDRGTAVVAMAQALHGFLSDSYQRGRMSGVIGLGGSGGTSLIASAMRGLPVGFPKLMVSTVASGDTSSYIGTSDITMMFSVVDVAGVNRVSRQIYRNAAAAIAGMARAKAASVEGRPAIGITMFGVTTPCVRQVREHLERAGLDCLVFHATGIGGRAMEDLAGSGLLSAVCDITTTEVADEVVGGVFPAGPTRFDVILKRRLPYVMSLGALDMVNFGPQETVPAPFKGRKFHIHNSSVTLMRTTVKENLACAAWIARKLNAHPDSAFALLIPEKGLSALDQEGGPFFDPEADQALFKELERLVRLGPNRRIVRHPLHINDPAFAEAIRREIEQLQIH
jgi:uncharacterized protein (UPF0261 family)